MSYSQFYSSQLGNKEGFSLPPTLSLIGKGCWIILPFAVALNYGGKAIARTFSTEAFRWIELFDGFLAVVIVAGLLAFLLDRPMSENLGERIKKALVNLIPTFIFAYLLSCFISHSFFSGLIGQEGNLKMFDEVSSPIFFAYIFAIISIFLGIKLFRFISLDTRSSARACGTFYKWANSCIASGNEAIKKNLKEDEEVKLVLWECVTSSSNPEVAAATLLSLTYALFSTTAVAALASMGEGCIVTSILIWIPITLAFFLLYPSNRWQMRFGGICVFFAAVINFWLLPTLASTELIILVVSTLLFVALCFLFIKDVSHWLRRRMLVSTSQRQFIIDLKAEDNEPLFLKKVIALEEESDFTNIRFSCENSDSETEFCVYSEAELAALKECNSTLLFHLDQKGSPAFFGWRALPAIMVLIAALSWQVYWTIFLGLGLGLTTIVEIANMNDGLSEAMHNEQKTISIIFPWCAGMHCFRFIAAADSEDYEDAQIAYELTEKYSSGNGAIGKILSSARECNFIRFCKNAKALKEQVAKLPVPPGVPEEAFREIEYAKAYIELAKEMKGLLYARHINVVKHLRKAKKAAGKTYPKATVELIKALTRSGIYDFDKCAEHHGLKKGWLLEAKRLLPGLVGKIPTAQMDELRQAIVHSRPQAEKISNFSSEARGELAKAFVKVYNKEEGRYNVWPAKSNHHFLRDQDGFITGLEATKEGQKKKVYLSADFKLKAGEFEKLQNTFAETFFDLSDKRSYEEKNWSKRCSLRIMYDGSPFEIEVPSLDKASKGFKMLHKLLDEVSGRPLEK